MSGCFERTAASNAAASPCACARKERSPFPALPPESLLSTFACVQTACARSVVRIEQLKKQVVSLRGATSKHGRGLLYYSTLKAVAASRNDTTGGHDHLAALSAFIADPESGWPTMVSPHQQGSAEPQHAGQQGGDPASSQQPV